MDRTRENTVILAVFLTLLIAVTVMTIVSSKRSGSARPSPAAAVQLHPAAADDNATASAPALLDARAVAMNWGSDPFARGEPQPAGGGPAAVTEAAGEDLVLSLVLISGSQKTARINNRSYREGDVVNGAKIVSIQKDGVVLDRNGARTLLTKKKRPIVLRERKPSPR